jgi:hypothetical protein
MTEDHRSTLSPREMEGRFDMSLFARAVSNRTNEACVVQASRRPTGFRSTREMEFSCRVDCEPGFQFRYYSERCIEAEKAVFPGENVPLDVVTGEIDR